MHAYIDTTYKTLLTFARLLSSLNRFLRLHVLPYLIHILPRLPPDGLVRLRVLHILHVPLRALLRQLRS